MKIRYNYCENNTSLNNTLSNGKYCSHRFVTDIPIDASALSLDGSEYFHAVEAKKEGNNITIRVITNLNCGMNVIVPIKNKVLYDKYIDLRYQIRNRDYVKVAFPSLEICPIAHPGISGLYLLAKDFKQYDDNTNTVAPPRPTIEI